MTKEATEEAIAAAAAVGEASKAHTKQMFSSAVKSAKKAAKVAKAAAKAAEASKAVATAKASTAASKKAEAEAAAAAAKALKKAASNASDNSSAVKSSSSSSYSSSSSSTEGEPVSAGGSWLVQVRKRKKAEAIVGCKEGGDLEGVAPRVKDFWDLFISNLSEKSTNFQIKSYLQNHGIEVKEVWVLNSKKRGTKSAKVRIALEHKNKAREPNIWSKHIRVQDWVRKPSRNSEA